MSEKLFFHSTETVSEPEEYNNILDSDEYLFCMGGVACGNYLDFCELGDALSEPSTEQLASEIADDNGDYLISA